MLTAIVAASDDPISLAETLSALVPAAVEGLVRRAIVVTAREPGAKAAQIIEASGADQLTADGEGIDLWRAGLRNAQPGWRLCLVAGSVPTSPWMDAVERHIATSDRDAVFHPSGLLGRRLGAGLMRLAGHADLRAGLLTRRNDLAIRLRPVKLAARIEDRTPSPSR